jgi:hypothetical protein
MVQLTPTGWSPDANWFWDGRAWQDAISPDGKWRYNGTEWRRFRGKRTAMPVAPLWVAAPSAPPPAPVAPIEMPSWVAPSEVERIVKEKQEAEAYAATPVIPPPPELDWRKAGHYIRHSKDEGDYKDWQVGGTSIAYFIILYFLCSFAGLIFIWRTGWRLPTKVLVTLGGFFLPVAIYFIAVGTGLIPQDYRR